MVIFSTILKFQDAFASSFFPFSLNSISEKSSTSFENNNYNNNNNNNRKKLPYSSQPQATAGSNNYCSASSTCSSSALSSPSTSSGVNFTNILQAAFSHKNVLRYLFLCTMKAA